MGEIAVIGLALKFPMAENKEEYWHLIENKIDAIRDLPLNRYQDIKDYMQELNLLEKVEIQKQGYLEHIDFFDHEFFNISPKESKLMSPAQRHFFQICWQVLEDAGYGNKQLYGSKTGVFLGSMANQDYQNIIKSLSQSNAISFVGNTHSIIPSRISYIMDFKGPTMAIDTACSSSLVAVHQACLSLLSKECDYAIAGGVRFNILPFAKNEEEKIGIESSDYKARTFDLQSDGTGWGEGVAAVLLKPLKKAVSDKDHIYALIKTSAVNQDGRSVGITLPSFDAQKKLLIETWKKAKINPEQLSYIEAHGTGTKLGDPIEVDAISAAIKEFTDKKQFCATGSVKSNIGHLGCMAGLAGFIKALLILKYKKIPPTLHFHSPNKRINFPESGVFVNDRLIEPKEAHSKMLCAVSSFGLSGTNAHVVLEEYKQPKELEKKQNSLYIIAFSAKNAQVLQKSVTQFKNYLKEHDDNYLTENLGNICYTANTARNHYNHRIIIIFKNLKELNQKIHEITIGDLNLKALENTYYGFHRIVAGKKKQNSEDLNQSEKNALNNKVNSLLKNFNEASSQKELEEIAKLYIQGAELNWELLYPRNEYRRLSIPSYPFSEIRHWIEVEKGLSKSLDFKKNQDILRENEIILSSKHRWEIREHIIADKPTLVGTGYFDLVLDQLKLKKDEESILFSNIYFFKAIQVQKGGVKKVSININLDKDNYNFDISSFSKEKKINHVQGSFSFTKKKVEKIHFDDTLCQFKKGLTLENKALSEQNHFGIHWQCLEQAWLNDNSDALLLKIKAPDFILGELKYYKLHPSLCDVALNAIGVHKSSMKQFLGKEDENDVFLPFSYEELLILDKTPAEFYSMIRKITSTKNTVHLNVVLFDLKGNIFAKVQNYVLKKVNLTPKTLIWKKNWERITDKINFDKKENKEEKILIINNSSPIMNELREALEKKSHFVSIIDLNENKLKELEEPGAKQFFKSINLKEITQIIYLASLKTPNNFKRFNQKLYQSITGFFLFIKALAYQNIEPSYSLITLTQNSWAVNSHQNIIQPLNTSIHSMAQVFAKEQSNITVLSLDTDENTDIKIIADNILNRSIKSNIAFRDNELYEPILESHFMEKLKQENIIKKEGVYIISGGLGGIGLEIAQFIASQNNVKLILLNRSKIPSKEKWSSVQDKKLLTKIKLIQEIEKSGSKVFCYSVDVANLEAMTAVIDLVKKDFKQINGVIHSAGVSGKGLIYTKEQTEFSNVLSSKVQGSWILDELTQDQDLDFFVLFSSIATLSCPMGQSDYVAANSFIQAFSHYQNQKGRKSTCILWPAWEETGMAFELGALKGGSFKAIKTKTAIKEFEKVLSASSGEFIIGELQNPTLLSYKVVSKSDEDFDSLSEQVNKNIGMPKMNTEPPSKNDLKVIGKDFSELTEVENNIAQIWGEELELDKIDIYEHFADMGADSITSTKALKRISDLYPKTISIADIFTYSSISLLAEQITKKLNQNSGQSNEEKMKEILDKIENGEIETAEGLMLLEELNNSNTEDLNHES